MSTTIRINDGCLNFPADSVDVTTIVQQTGGSGVVTFNGLRPCLGTLSAGEYLVTGLGTSTIPPITSHFSSQDTLTLQPVLPSRIFDPNHVSVDSIARISGNGATCSLGTMVKRDIFSEFDDALKRQNDVIEQLVQQISIISEENKASGRIINRAITKLLTYAEHNQETSPTEGQLECSVCQHKYGASRIEKLKSCVHHICKNCYLFLPVSRENYICCPICRAEIIDN